MGFNFMRAITLFSPYIAFLFSALSGIVFRKSWMSIFCASIAFFAVTYLIFGAINMILEKQTKK
jgi:hypothetical protein